MPAYSFQERFVPFILDGSKKQTVRNRRRYPAKPGDKLHLYSGLRTKYCRKLREEICTMVTSLYIGDDQVIIYDNTLNNLELDMAETQPDGLPIHRLPIHTIWQGADADRFAWLDGFRPDGSTEENPAGAFQLMLRFWRQTHSLPWAGDIIYWNLNCL